MFCRILCCFIAKFLFYAIYAVLSRNLFCRNLRALAWRKIGPTILSVEKKGQISGMIVNLLGMLKWLTKDCPQDVFAWHIKTVDIGLSLRQLGPTFAPSALSSASGTSEQEARMHFHFLAPPILELEEQNSFSYSFSTKYKKKWAKAICDPVNLCDGVNKRQLWPSWVATCQHCFVYASSHLLLTEQALLHS